MADDDLDQIEASLQAVAARLNSCHPDPNATVKYDLLANALIWPDELPAPQQPGEFSKLSMVRVLQRHRTTVILGTPSLELEKYWLLGKRLFPQWCGFQQDRITTSDERVALYWKHNPWKQRDEAENEWKAMQDRLSES
ncbi:MAG: hypothetical protein KDA89_25290 [Planctomycetaceae bacterium]|nr:hypothetical protein [Planctomycetaceae bacterium]